MAALRDPFILAMYLSVVRQCRYDGYVEWNDRSLAWIKRELPGLRYREINQLIRQYVEAGGEIDQVREHRPDYNDRDYHYDLRLQVTGRLVYIETILVDDNPRDPTVRVVNIHDA